MVGMDLKEVQKQGRDERMQEDIGKQYTADVGAVFLRTLISALFHYFFRSILTWNEVLQKHFLSYTFISFLGEF